MPSESYDFTGRTALVTGAGRGLGRAYALELARLGAFVVVNDLGGSISGRGHDDGPAAAVVADITAADGSAIADAHDVADPDGAAAMVAAAIGATGRLDAVVNNAGMVRWAGPEKIDVETFDQHVAVHLRGSFLTARAAWPHFLEQGSGRLVMTTSTGMLGLPTNLSYAAAKGGVVGLTRSLAVAGRRHDIKANAIAPAAMTRMADPDVDDASGHDLDPALVAPIVALLAHERCPTTGEILAAGGGRFSRLFIGSTPGWVHEGDGAPSVDDLAEHWDDVVAESGYDVPADLPAWSAAFLAHLEST